MRRLSLLLLSLVATAACSGGSGTSGGNGNGSVQGGTVDPSLVGIWQQTVASGSTVTNVTTGQTWDMTQGYSATLKVRKDGTFVFQHFSSGSSSSCAKVSYLDSATGAVDFSADRLVLRPTQRTLDVDSCEDSGKRDLGTAPLEFTAAVAPYETLIKERTLAAELSGPYSLKLKLLQADPPPESPDTPTPSGFQLGQDPPSAELQGTWASSENSDLGFYDPSSGAFRVPAYNGAEHHWVRFSGNEYETAIVIDRANEEGVCKKDIVYWEKGTATFATLETGSKTGGDVKLRASEARLVVQVRECGSDDGVKTYSLKPIESYFKWEYSPSYGFLFGCEYPRNPYQFATCTNNVGWNTFRKR